MASRFPPELLEQVFDHLDPKHRKVARLVNKMWANVLWTDKCLRKQVLLVNPATLTDDLVLQQMKRPYSEIHISSGEISADGWKSAYFERVKKLITSPVITRNVKIIKLDANVKVLNFLFYQRSYRVLYTQLEEFTFLTNVDNLCGGNVMMNAVFPKLKVLKLDALSRGSIGLIYIYARQITKLVVKIAYRRQLLAILALRNLNKLTELAVGTMAHSTSNRELLTRNDFAPYHYVMLRRLRRLEINDAANMFVATFHYILGETRNLTHLRITGVEMSPAVLVVANELVNLRFLQLLARSGNLDYRPMVQFDLPHLETLHLAPQLMARAGNLPKLHTLGIINHTNQSVTWHYFTGPAALKSFTAVETLRKLHVRGIYFSSRNLHPTVHFNSSCKVFLEDKDDFPIGSVNIRGPADVDQLRCHHRGEIDFLTIRRPTVPGAEVDNDMTQLAGTHNTVGCWVWIEHELSKHLEEFCDRVALEYRACKRAIQRNNLYNIQKYGCLCNHPYYREY